MNRKFLATVFLFFLSLQLKSQNNVGIGTVNPEASAMLDITATDRGILIPRVSLTNITSSVPVNLAVPGLLIWNTNASVTGGTGIGFYYWDGAKWQSLLADDKGWKLSGNGGTNPATQFFGTTDNQPLNFRVNNLQVGKIDPGFFNTLLGAGAGISLSPTSPTTSQKNVFIGDSSGRNTITGAQNTFIGFRSGHSNNGGFDNTFIGHRSGTLNTASNNTFIGSYAGELNTSGQYNFFAGNAAGQINSTGNQNTFVGFFAGINNTTASDNTFIGFRAGHNNTVGINNTFIGTHAGFFNVTGQSNVFLGNSAGQENTEGSYNTFLGFIPASVIPRAVKIHS